MSAFTQIVMKPNKAAFCEKRQLPSGSSKRNKAQFPVPVPRARIEPCAIGGRMILPKHLRQLLPIRGIGTEQQLGRPAHLLNKVAHSRRPRGDLGKNQCLTSRMKHIAKLEFRLTSTKVDISCIEVKEAGHAQHSSLYSPSLSVWFQVGRLIIGTAIRPTS
jgi:hypothetical protein